MTQSDADLVFLPWVQRGASAALLQPDTNGADLPGLTTATASVEVNSARTASTPVTVLGPGHVTGLDRRQIVRMDPAPGATAFESNFFPLVELDEPALPWLFTPASASADGHLRPWLCLVVVRQQDGVRLDPPPTGGLAVLRIGAPAKAGDELPDLADGWAWAHGQLTAKTTDDLTGILASDPVRSVSRLLCPRVLRPDSSYVACVVPTFELGRKAGLGQEVSGIDESRLEPAWTPGASTVELPVYHSWTFTTGAGGDFQSLALLLRARPLPDGIGEMEIDVGESGLLSGVPPRTTLPLHGALQPVGTTPRGWSDPGLEAMWEQALTPVLNAPAQVTAEEDPLLAPPLYGAAQAGLESIEPTQTARWFEQLNLSPANRAVAHLGAQVVQQRQDELMASAWDQAAELRRVNQLLRQAQLGERVASSLHARHLERMDPQTGLQVLAPAQARMLRTSTALAEQFAGTGLTAAAFSTALRRVARPRGGLNRRLRRVSPTPIKPTTSLLVQLQPVKVMGRIVAGGRDTGPVTLERVAAGFGFDVTWGEATDAEVRATPQRAFFQVVPMGQPVPMGSGPGDPGVPGSPGVDPTGSLVLSDSAAAALFRDAAAENLARFNPPRPIEGPSQLPDGSLDAVFAEFVARTAPQVTFADRSRAAFTIPGADRQDDAALDRVELSPYFPQPMVEALSEIAQGHVLPGLDLVPPNTVVALETNTTFVQSYLVGLNTEMGRELLWRDYPADLRSTYFDRFWNASSAPGRAPDIDRIDSWGSRSLGVAADDEDFVLLVRSELLRRYPDAIIYATKGSEERHPIFTGGFAPEVRFFGFDIDAADIDDWHIVIQEHPSAPRFGIEVGTDTGGRTHLAPAGPDAALTARAVRQLPVRISIPATVLMRSE
ncbi:MAG TPA: hypothetical protein VER39_00305 [Nocardioidaceae bacterium]|nr:hypothetical protein [Nocardioidaceae bacterium]